MSELKLRLPPIPDSSEAIRQDVVHTHELREQWMVHVLRACLDAQTQGEHQKVRAMLGEALSQLTLGA